MTDHLDPLDQLASALLDGELDPAEQAEARRDPVVAERVETFRSVSGAVSAVPSPPPELRRRQLSAALAEFEARSEHEADHDRVELLRQVAPGPEAGEPHRDGEADAAEVIGLTGGRQGRRRTRSNGAPSWLAAAAVVVVALGGIGWLVSSGLSGQSDTDEAAFDVATESDAAPLADEDASIGEAAAADESSTTAAATAAGGTEGAAAAADGEAQTESDDAELEEEAADDTSGGAAEPGAAPLVSREDVEGARRSYETVPSDEELTSQVDVALAGPELSECAAVVTIPPDTEIVGFIPVSVNGLVGEALLVVDRFGEQTFFVVDTSCVLID